jgi:hypothetical protein
MYTFIINTLFFRNISVQSFKESFPMIFQAILRAECVLDLCVFLSLSLVVLEDFRNHGSVNDDFIFVFAFGLIEVAL